MDPRTRPLSVSEELPVNWGQCCVWRNVKTRALRRRSRLHSSDVHGRTYMDRFASGRAQHQRTPGPRLPVVARHAADRATARRALAPLPLSRSLHVHRYTAHEAAAMARIQIRDRSLAACHRGRLFWARYHSLHQSAPACTTHAGDSRGPESSSRGPAHMWRLFVDPQSHRLPLVVAVQPALPLLLRILLLSASCTLAGHAASPIASSPARAASTSAPEGGGARPGSRTPTVS